MLSALIAFFPEKLSLWKALQLQPRKAKLVSQCKPASLPYFILHISWGELSEHGATCVSACMNENVCVKSASEARSNFSCMSERLLTETEGCGGVSLTAALLYRHAERMGDERWGRWHGRTRHKHAKRWTFLFFNYYLKSFLMVVEAKNTSATTGGCLKLLVHAWTICQFADYSTDRILIASCFKGQFCATDRLFKGVKMTSAYAGSDL